MREIKFSLQGDQVSFPELKFYSLPFDISAMDKDRDEYLILHPGPTFDLCTMTPRERWKYESQKLRLERRGIVLDDRIRGYVGSLHGVRITP